MYLAASSKFPEALYIATIVLFSILLPPTLYIWRKHGRPGFLGYNFVWAICAIRITGSALSIAAIKQPSLETSATILNSMIISPLILAALGLLLEARKASCLVFRERLERFLAIVSHAIVFAGIALIIVGIVHMFNGTSTSQDAVLLKVGLALLVISYATISLWTFYSMRASIFANSATFPDGTKLLYAVILSLPFIGFRLVYGLLSLLLTDPAFADSLAAKVVLSLIPELIATAIFVVAGLVTRNMWKDAKRSKSVEFEKVPRHRRR